MATLKEYFDKDFGHTLKVHQPQRIRSSADGSETDVVPRLHFDFDAGVTYISIYVPSSNYCRELCIHLLDNLDLALSLVKTAECKCGFAGEALVKTSDLKFSQRVFLYVDEQVPPVTYEKLMAHAESRGIALRVRDQSYAIERSRLEKPLAFISHDWRDKDAVARPLAEWLSNRMCPVWFDEYSLNVGDNLRESIEKGLRECKKCILVLSPHFLGNSGWTKVEFDSVFTREIVEKQRVVLPIWHGVTREDVYAYSPSLANKVALHWEAGIEEVARKLIRAIND